MGRMVVRQVRATTFVHATEDEGKVMKAVYSVFPPDVRGKLRVKRSMYKGHWGNPIVVIDVSLQDYGEALKTARWIAGKLSDLDRRLLSFEVRDRVDRSMNLYLRFNKQSAYRGSLEIDNGDDVIRVVLGFRGSRRLEDLKEYLRELGMIKG